MPVPVRSYLLCPQSVARRVEDTWPTVYLPSQVEPYLKAGRHKIRYESWANAIHVDIEAECAEVLESVPPVPFAQAGLRHGFHSPLSGAPLLFRAETDAYFLDPTTGAELTSWSQRRAHTLLAHWRTLQIMRSFAVQAQLRHDDRYLAWPLAGLRLLRDYAAFFSRVRPWKREPYEPLYGSVVEDAGLLILLANFHAVAQGMETYDEAKHEHALDLAGDLAASLLRAAEAGSDALTPPERVHVTTALALAGRTFGVDGWVTLATETLGGLRGVLRDCLSRLPDGSTDGFLRGGSVLDHLQAMPALLALYVDSAEDDDALDLEMLLVMQAPLSLADHDLALPVIGRYGTPESLSLQAMQPVYELAATQLDADIYGPVLAAIVHQGDGQRGLWSITLGPDSLPIGDGLSDGPSLLTANQILVMRGDPQEPTVTFRAGHSEGDSAHADTGGVFLRVAGQPISPDPGDPGIKMDAEVRDYLASFLAHNTVMLGEAAFPGDPELSWLAHTEPPQALVRIATGEGSDEVERRVIRDGHLLIVADTFALAREQEAGSAWSALGQVAVRSHDTVADPPTRNSGGLGAVPADGPWAGLTEHRYLHTPASGVVHLRWPCAPDLWLDALCLSDSPGDLLVATPPTSVAALPQTLVVRRSRGVAWTAVSVFDIHSGTPQLADAHWSPDERLLTVTLADGERRAYSLLPADFA